MGTVLYQLRNLIEHNLRPEYKEYSGPNRLLTGILHCVINDNLTLILTLSFGKNCPF